jgi:phosphoribosylformylglycinamidine (FGAM) synthase PurS component
MKIGVKIMPRNEVLDTQGRAVEETLKRNGKILSTCRVGRFVELEFAEDNLTKALARAKEIAEFVLHNPLIETYELTALDHQ